MSLSFEQPVETQESIYGATLTLLEAIRFTGKGIRFYNACSSECFGDLKGAAANEETPFRPRSPYAVAKSAAFCKWPITGKLTGCSPVREFSSTMNPRCGGALRNKKKSRRPPVESPPATRKNWF